MDWRTLGVLEQQSVLCTLPDGVKMPVASLFPDGRLGDVVGDVSCQERLVIVWFSFQLVV